MGTTTITDIPRKGSAEHDRFGLMAYEKGLEAFLRGSSTPITVALQGEWGSGKTSLMNVLNDDLCNENGEFYSIWINTWEFSLMRSSNEALLQILFKMANEVVKLIQTAGEEVIGSIKKNLSVLGMSVARSLANKALDGFGDSIMDIFNKEGGNSIADLREKLEQQINVCINKSQNKKGIIFFIDDLDRIDPPVAVELLELLKNVFTLKHCLFVLAIDYDVVIKGLKPKFGELNEQNEREFRSFFDKIIQVPFSMPVSQYSTKNYLIDELKGIGIIDSADLSNEKLTNDLNKAEILTIGSNPRSIKRFLNTLSMIKCINNACDETATLNDGEREESKETRDLKILLNLSIVGLQVAYPKIYQLLCLEPGFTMWDDRIAAKMGVRQIDNETKDRLDKFEEFDELWEQVLYRVCLTDKHLQKNAINISRLFNMMRNEIKSVVSNDEESSYETSPEAENNFIKEFMQEQMSQAFVTSLSSNDTEPLAYDAVQLTHNIQRKLYEHLKQTYVDAGFRAPKVKTTNGRITTYKQFPDLQIWQNNPENHKIRIQFRLQTKQVLAENCQQYMPVPPPPLDKFTKDDVSALKDKDLPLFTGFFKLGETIAANNCYQLWAERHILDGKLKFLLCFDVTFDNPDAFLEEQNIKFMQEVIGTIFYIGFEVAKM